MLIDLLHNIYIYVIDVMNKFKFAFNEKINMIYKKKYLIKKSSLAIIFSILAMIFISGSGFIYVTTPLINSGKSIKDIVPKSSGSWNLVGTPININANWAAINASNEWCNGAGTIGDPYIIENVTINAIGAPDSTGIQIKNTVDYIIIRNCTILNAGNIGINLDNASNGILTNNTFESNYRGIWLSHP